MFGKLFSQTFTGSLMGAGPEVFSVWTYVISTAVDGQVELNPKLLATIIGMPEQAVKDAIQKLCEPDPESRNTEEEGRRMIKEGRFAYKVVSHSTYRKMIDQDQRREYNRTKKREQRAREQGTPAKAKANPAKKAYKPYPVDDQFSNLGTTGKPLAISPEEYGKVAAAIQNGVAKKGSK